MLLSFQFLCGLVLIATVIVWFRRVRAAFRSNLIRGEAAPGDDLFEQPFAGFLEIDKDGKVLRVNQRECQLRGLDRSSLVGANFAELNQHPDPVRFREEVQLRCIQEGVPPPYRASYPRPDGTAAIIEVHETLLRDRNGRVAGIRFASLDITDRHLIEASASATTAELNAVFQAFPDLCLRLDRQGNVLDCRGGQESDPLLRPRTYAGKRLSEVLNQATAAKCLEAICRVNHSRTAESIECAERGPNGDLFYEIRLIALDRDQFMAIIRNVSEARAAQDRNTSYAQELEAKNRELEAAMTTARDAIRLKSRFLANISHEIRTPLNGIFGMIDLLQSTPLSTEQQDYAQTLRESASALLPIINDILDLAKMEAGKLRLERKPFSLAVLSTQIAALFEKRAHAKGLRFLAEIPPSLPENAIGDANRLRQILSNLLDNAVKFTEQGDVIFRVSIEQESPDQVGVRFTVSDTGIGIAGEQLDRIFESFTQGDGSASRKYGGTGLGLAISKHLVELLGGHIAVTSTPGEGSTFWFGIGLEKSARPAPEEIRVSAPTPLSNPGGLRSLRVLIAEDNELNKKLSLRLLGKLGIEAEAVSDGRQAVDAVSKKAFDMILMDCQMPEMDGFEATAIIREKERNHRHTPICALTANAMDGDRERCLAAGMDDYLCKPIGLDQLRGVVERWTVVPEMKS